MMLSPLSPHLVEYVGVIGFGLYVMNYTLLTTRVITGNSLLYFTVNLTAALCVLIGLTVSFNLAAALIQMFWVCMSLIGIALYLIRPPVGPV